MESWKLSMQVMRKVLTTSWFITCLLIFYEVYFIIFMSYIYFVFKSILYLSCLLLYFFNQLGKGLVYLRQFVLNKSFYLTASPCWGFGALGTWLLSADCYFNCILLIFYNFFNYKLREIIIIITIKIIITTIIMRRRTQSKIYDGAFL